MTISRGKPISSPHVDHSTSQSPLSLAHLPLGAKWGSAGTRAPAFPGWDSAGKALGWVWFGVGSGRGV